MRRVGLEARERGDVPAAGGDKDGDEAQEAACQGRERDAELGYTGGRADGERERGGGSKVEREEEGDVLRSDPAAGGIDVARKRRNTVKLSAHCGGREGVAS